MHTKVVGILNVTPNSFSDGGLYLDTKAAAKQTLLMISEGASVIDIGAESADPRNAPITEEEELSRLEDTLPKVIEICKNHGVESSIDTRKPNIAAVASKMGIDYINDVSGGVDPLMLKVVADNPRLKFIAVNGIIGPRNVQESRGSVEEVINWSHDLVRRASEINIQKERIIIDPGVGFGKNIEYSWNIIRNLDAIRDAVKQPIYIGHSRKSFLRGELPGVLPAQDADLETIVLSVYLVKKRVDFVRIHNIAAHMRMLRIMSLVESIETTF